MLRAILLFASLWSAVCVTTRVEYEPVPVVEWRSPKTIDSLPITQAKNLGKFKITYYWIVEETKYSGDRTNPLYLEDGKLLGYYTRKFVADFKKEAVARLKDGRIISYLKRRQTAKIVDEPLGYQGYTLSILKSVAVDTKVIPIGSMIYIPNFEGLYLGENGVHNGVFYANDIGSEVKGNHIDIYIGYQENLKYLVSKSGSSSSLVDVYLLK